MKLKILSVFFLLLCFYPSVIQSQEKRSDVVVIKAMEDELKRSSQELKLDGYETPYFISYQIKDNEYYRIKGKYGSVLLSDRSRQRRLFVDVRVGNYELDNSIIGKSGGNFHSYDSAYIPVDNDISAIRAILWQATDRAYKEALTQYFNKKANYVRKVKADDFPSFSRENIHAYYGAEADLVFDREVWESNVREISAVYKDYKELTDADVSVTAQKETVYFVNSEGTRYVTDEILYSVDANVQTRAEDGTVLRNYSNLYYRSPKDIPGTEEIKSLIKKMVEETLEMRKAATIPPINAPAILEPEAAGIMFHEAVGHRLEGERQIDENDGQTFKGRLGEKIIPQFLSISDNPAMKNFGATDLLGYYPFDDQGVPGSRVVLVENGVLKNFLLSRTPIDGFYRSNGHGRASYGKAPMARMSNLFVESDKRETREDLKKLLLDEVKRRNKPFGLIIKKMSGGETNTSSYNFQAFKATPLVIYKVDPATGEETPVRGVEIVGTPLVSINNIVAAGNDYGVFNGFCGAESGYVPVSAIAPSVLISEIELQRISDEKEKTPSPPPAVFRWDRVAGVTQFSLFISG